MSHSHKKRIYRSCIWFLAGAAFLLTLIMVPLFGQYVPLSLGWAGRFNPMVQETLEELKQLGIYEHTSKATIYDLIEHKQATGKSLGHVLRDPVWAKRLGLLTSTFKSTWYISNPFDVLPVDVKQAILEKKIPFKSRTHVWQWCRQHKIPRKYRRALYAALIETTPHNLWRASRGHRPIAKNGQFLEPIVVDHGQGQLEIRDGHIATDPKIIPTNSEVLLLVRIQGEDRVLRVKAADIGGAIKGRHVDLPIHVGPETKEFPHTRLPSKYIRNRTVQILVPQNQSSLGQKA